MDVSMVLRVIARGDFVDSFLFKWFNLFAFTIRFMSDNTWQATFVTLGVRYINDFVPSRRVFRFRISFYRLLGRISSTDMGVRVIVAIFFARRRGIF